MTTRSFFKLPALLSFSYVLLSFIVNQCIYYFHFFKPNSENHVNIYMLNIFINQEIVSSIVMFLFLFMITTIACNKYKWHKLNKFNIISILGIVLTIYLIKFSEAFLWRYLLIFEISHHIIKSSYHSNVESILITILNITTICIALFASFRILSRNKQKTQHLNLTIKNSRTTHAILYSLIFYTPSLFSFKILFLYLMELWAYKYESFTLLPSMVTLIAIVINFLLFYYSIRNCFPSLTSTLQIKKLFKSALLSLGITLLYSFIILVPTVTYSLYFISSLMESGITVLIFVAVNFALICMISRFSIRRYFSRESASITPDNH